MSAASEGSASKVHQPRTVYLKAAPSWVGGNEQILMWVEIGDGAGTQIWEPDSPGEKAAARQFFQAAQAIDWTDGATHDVTIPGYTSGE
jgi:hypothetical protein